MHLPRALAEEFLEVDALCLDRPAPTEELVQATMARCEEALKDFHPAKPTATMDVPDPLFSGVPQESVATWAHFMGALTECVADRVVLFARTNPREAPLIVVDNDGLIDPELWASDPSLVMLQHLYTGADDAVKTVSGSPINRLIILKEDLDTYDERDLMVMRRAIEQPITKDTYLVAAKDAGPFRARGYAVIAKEVLFEIEKGDKPDSYVVRAPCGVHDPAKATEVYRKFSAVKEKAFLVYEEGKMNPRLQAALRRKDNSQLLEVLRSVGQHGGKAK